MRSAYVRRLVAPKCNRCFPPVVVTKNRISKCDARDGTGTDAWICVSTTQRGKESVNDRQQKNLVRLDRWWRASRLPLIEVSRHMWEKIRVTALAPLVLFAWFTVVTVSLGSQLWPLLVGLR